jgi:hypothetical protein
MNDRHSIQFVPFSKAPGTRTRILARKLLRAYETKPLVRDLAIGIPVALGYFLLFWLVLAVS